MRLTWKTVYSTGEVWEFGNDGLVYKNGQPYQITTPEGRAIYQNGNWQNEFQYTDHLGNTRVSFKANGSQLEKVAETAFDPWGVVLNGLGQTNGFQNRWEMQGKESEKTFGLNRINFGARTYNPTSVVWDRIDMMAKKMPFISPYSYNFNNPLRFIDPNGLSPKDIVVVSAPKGATGSGDMRAGHMAVLIGRDKDKKGAGSWTFISKDGRDKSEKAPKYSNHITGGPSNYTILNFGTKADFDKFRKKILQDYTTEVRFVTNSDADEKAKIAAEASAKSWYHVTLSNCADVCSDALEAVGLDGGRRQQTGNPDVPVNNSFPAIPKSKI